MKVTKRNGQLEEIDLDKIHRVLEWAGEGLNVSTSEVELKSHLQFYEGIKTSDIHEVLIKTAADLISEETPDYQYLSARLAIFHIRKKAFKQFEPPRLYDHVKALSEKGLYDKELMKAYTEKEFDFLDEHIDHSKDMELAYAGVKQLEGKYLLKNRVTGQIYESPQIAYMLISATLFSREKNNRINKVIDFYNALSRKKISLPTPIMAGVRTPTRQYSSCVLIECDDSLDSINATSSAIVKYISSKAGIGINAGRIRALGSPIRGGEAFHTGCIPFYKHFQTAVKCCSQGGVRGGAATLFYPIWHLEVENLLVLKNNKGVEDNRVRHLDYGVQINKMMYQRLIEGGDITLFSPHDTKGLYDAFFEDQERFEFLYKKYEQDPNIRKKKVKAIELFSILAQERASTGRIYIHNVDHSNTHSPFDESVAPIRQSNLCMEIALPTKPLNDIYDENGEVALCTLAAFNLGEIEDLCELKSLSALLVRALDNLLDYQNYPVKAAELATKKRRPLGIGVVNYAYWLAKNGLYYSNGSANNKTHQLFESIQYWLMYASVELAKERGACDGFSETKLAKGLLPIDTYKKDVDKLVEVGLDCDWESLRRDILQYGIRNSTLTALMPSETSSQVLNATNGIEPPRGCISIKASKDGVLKQVVPEYERLKENYELLWNIPDNNGYLELVSIMQKFVDQSISANTNYDPMRFPEHKVPVKQIIKDILVAYRLGLKTLYYHNTRDGSGTAMESDDCAGGACKI
jgi:ribonucleoside-diphosphate reductase alpha chain